VGGIVEIEGIEEGASGVDDSLRDVVFVHKGDQLRRRLNILWRGCPSYQRRRGGGAQSVDNTERRGRHPSNLLL
jgi:hypothetical protein